MTGLRIQLPDPSSCASPLEYIERHLAPAATELHRIVNELLAPGATSAEECSMDMVPGKCSGSFSRLDKRLDESPKHVIFDGSEYFSVPTEILRAKQLKVQLTAVLYVKGKGAADFRLVRDDGAIIRGSSIHVSDKLAMEYSRIVPFGDHPDCISPDSRTYYIEAATLDRCVPVCRRFSLSFVYI